MPDSRISKDSAELSLSGQWFASMVIFSTGWLVTNVLVEAIRVKKLFHEIFRLHEPLNGDQTQQESNQVAVKKLPTTF